jgi:hypothetical protein
VGRASFGSTTIVGLLFLPGGGVVLPLSDICEFAAVLIVLGLAGLGFWVMHRGTWQDKMRGSSMDGERIRPPNDPFP